MDFIKVKNWENFQHYGKRNPPWIKLHNQLLENYEFECLPDASKAHLLCIWMLASRTNNNIKADANWIARKIGSTEKIDLKQLINSGFLELVSGESTAYDHASMSIASGLHHDIDSLPSEEESKGKQNKAKESKTRLDYSSWPNKPNEIIFNDWKRLRQSKKAPITQTVIDRMSSELHKALEKGFTVDQCLSEAVFKGWSGFKADWMKPSEQNNQSKGVNHVSTNFDKIPEGFNR